MIERLRRVLRRPRPVQPGGPPPPSPGHPPEWPEPPPAPDMSAAPLPAAPLPVPKDTPFRAAGDVDPAVWAQAFADLASPVDDVAACLEAVRGLSALALVKAIKESSLGRSESARATAMHWA